MLYIIYYILNLNPYYTKAVEARHLLSPILHDRDTPANQTPAVCRSAGNSFLGRTCKSRYVEPGHAAEPLYFVGTRLTLNAGLLAYRGLDRDGDFVDAVTVLHDIA